jgi:hypothetical protein
VVSLRHIRDALLAILLLNEVRVPAAAKPLDANT